MGEVKKLHRAIQDSLRGAGGGGGSSTPRKPIESPDSLRSTAFARVLDLVGEGEIVGFADRDNPLSCVFLNETPVANADGSLNFKNIQVESRVGTQTQDYIPNFDTIENEIAVAVEVRNDLPWTRAVNNTNLDALRVRISTPALSKADTTTGDITGYTINYKIELQVDGGVFNEMLASSFRGKTTTKYERTHRIDLPPAETGWVIRVTRTSPNASSSAIQDTMMVDSYAEIIDVKLRMPMSALVGVIVDAEQFNNIPSRAYRLKGRIIRIPTNYDPDNRTYTGVWDGTFKTLYSNNPAWVFYDMALNDRYGLGHLVPQDLIDKWTLYRIAQYCDGLVDDGFGGLEPRFTCNVFFQSQADALKVMQDLATVFRGIIYASGGSVTAVGDMPEDPVYTYTPANVLEGKFAYAGSARKVRHTIALVSWTDMNDFGRAKVEYVDDPESIARYGIQPTEIIAVGCTSRGQARRLGRYLLATERYETDSVVFSVGLDGTVVAPGKVIQIADPLRAGSRRGGRIVSAGANFVVVDAAPVVNVGDDLIVTLPTGVTEKRQISVINDRTVGTLTPFSAVPIPHSVWAVESSELALQLFRVLGVMEIEGDGLGYTINAIKHEPGKFAYADSGVLIESPPIAPMPTPVVPSPTGLQINARDVVHQNTTVKVVNLSWNPVSGAVAYQVQWRESNGGWIDLGKTAAFNIDLTGVKPGPFEVQVVAVNAMGQRSAPAFGGPYDITPVATPPGYVEEIITSMDVLEGVGLQNATDIAQEILDRQATDAALAIAQAQLAVLQGQVGDILQADAWAIGNAYPAGDLVQNSGKLYRALQAVPAGTAITNTAYWELIGNYASLGEAVGATAAQVAANTTAVNELDGDLTALTLTVDQHATDIAGKASNAALSLLETRVTDAEGDITANTNSITSLNSQIAGKADTSALNALTTRVGTAEGNITSNANAITSLTATVNTKASTSALNALDARVTTAEGSLTAQSTQLTQLEASNMDGVAILNPSFEYIGDWGTLGNEAAGILPAGVSYYGPSGTAAYKYSGQWSLLIEPGGGRTIYNRAKFSVNGGQQVPVSFRVRPQAGTQPEAGASVRLSCRWYDASGNFLSNTHSTAFVSDGVTAYNFNSAAAFIQYTHTAPATAAVGQFFIQQFGTMTQGAFFVDDLRAQLPTIAADANAAAISSLEARVTTAEGVNSAQATSITSLTATVDGVAQSAVTVLNPSFEYVGDWSLPAGFSYLIPAGADNRVRSGKCSLQVAPTSSQVALNAQFVPVVVGQKIAAKMGVRNYGTNSGAKVAARMYFYDANKTYLSSFNAYEYASTGTAQLYVVGEGTVAAPTNAAYVKFGIYCSPPPTAGQFYVDDCEMAPEVVQNPAVATAVSALDARVSVNEAGLTTYQASYTLVLDVNGYVSGFKSVNDGTTATFSIVADKFNVVAPAGGDALTWNAGVLTALKGSNAVKIGAGFGSDTDKLILYYGANGTDATRTLANALVGITAAGKTKLAGTWSNFVSGWDSGAVATATYSSAIPAVVTFNITAGVFKTSGQVINYNAGSGTVSQTRGTTVKYYLYYSDPGQTGGSKTLGISTDYRVQYDDPNKVYIGAVSVTVPASGSGTGGGGGAQCPSINAWVIRRNKEGAKEYVRAGQVRVGDYLYLCDGRWGKVTYSKEAWESCVRVIGKSGKSLTCSWNAPLRNGEDHVLAQWARGCDVDTLRDYAIQSEGVDDVLNVGLQLIQAITCEDAFYWVGDDQDCMFAHHNLKFEPNP